MKPSPGSRVLSFSAAVVVAFVSGVPGRADSTDEGSEAQSLAAIRLAHEVEIEEIEKPFRERVSKLNESYVKALGRLLDEVQNRADLDGAVALRDEIETVESTGRPGDEPYPESGSMRSKYQDALASIDEQRQQAVAKVLQGHHSELGDLAAELTRKGKLEAALEVETARKEVAKRMRRLSETSVTAIPSSRERMPPADGGPVENSELHGVERFVGEVTLEPGRYSLPERVILGNPKLEDRPREERGGTVEVVPGTQFDELDLSIDHGHLGAAGARFLGATIRIDLGGSMKARDSLFDKCTIRKGGAWSTRYYSAKWTLENCLLFRCFVEPLTPRANGVDLVECTVVQATLGPTDYYDTPVEESGHEWRRIERCRFVECEIPESTLLMMEDCVFEDCTFVPDIANVEPEKSARVTLYFDDLSSDPPPGNEEMTFVRETATALDQRVGSTFDYDVTADRITLR